MGEAYLDWQSKSGGIKLNDVIEEYRYVANGKSVKKGDLLTYVGEDVAPAIEPPFNAIALSSGVGAPEFVEAEVTKTGNAFLTTWENVSDGEAVGANGNVLTVDLSGVNSGSLISSSCDGNESSYSEISMDSIRWVKMGLSNPLKITNMKLKFTVGNANAFDYAKIEGSNNNSEWIELYRTTSAISSLTEIPLNNPDYYKYYRIYISSSISTTAAIKLYEWQTSEYIVKEQIPSTEHNEQVKIARVYKETLYTDNIIPTLWNVVTDKTKYSSSGYVLEASSTLSSTYSANNACDNDTSTLWGSIAGTENWLKLTAPKPVKITKMKTYIKCSNSYFASAIIQGSNDNSKWDNLYTLSTPQTQLEEIVLQNNNEYINYRILVNSTDNANAYVYEWQVSEYAEVIQ